MCADRQADQKQLCISAYDAETWGGGEVKLNNHQGWGTAAGELYVHLWNNPFVELHLHRHLLMGSVSACLSKLVYGTEGQLKGWRRPVRPKSTLKHSPGHLS